MTAAGSKNRFELQHTVQKTLNGVYFGRADTLGDLRDKTTASDDLADDSADTWTR